MKDLVQKLEEAQSNASVSEATQWSRGISDGDTLRVTKTGLQGTVKVWKRIPKGKILKVVATGQGPNRNMMWVQRQDRPKDGILTISEDRDLDKVVKI